MFKALFGALLTLIAFITPAYAAEVHVNAGTRVPIVLPNTVSSDVLEDQLAIQAQVQRDVIVDNMVVFKKGAPVELAISKVRDSGTLGKAGKLELSGGTIKPVNGNKPIPVNFSYKAKGNGKRGTAITLFIIGLPLLVLFGLGVIPIAAAFAMSGKPASIQGGQVFDTFTTAPQVITVNDDNEEAIETENKDSDINSEE